MSSRPDWDKQKRPVMVWIHGGGFGIGAALAHVLTAPISRNVGTVVAISLHHRLGALGYCHLGEFDPAFAHRAMSVSSISLPHCSGFATTSKPSAAIQIA